MALARQSRGGMNGWVAAALLALGIYASVAKDSEPAPELSPDTTVELVANR